MARRERNVEQDAKLIERSTNKKKKKTENSVANVKKINASKYWFNKSR